MFRKTTKVTRTTVRRMPHIYPKEKKKSDKVDIIINYLHIYSAIKFFVFDVILVKLVLVDVII